MTEPYSPSGRRRSRGELSKARRESKLEVREGAVAKLKELFRRWDTDGNGLISRNELKMFVKSMGVVGEDDVDALLQEADKDGNNAIDYDEFIEWLMRPGSSISQCDNGLVLFDLQSALQPLFNVFDRDRSGFITFQEFQEIHLILSNSLQLCPMEDGEAPDPEMMSKPADRVFKAVDGDNSRTISLEEFVEWQRKAIQDSGLVNSEIQELVQSLANSVQSVFKIEEADKAGTTSSSDTACLTRIIEKIATHTRDLWNTQKATAFETRTSCKGKYPNMWSEPPVGLNIDKLRVAHMQHHPLRMRGVLKTTLEVFCLPEMPQEPGKFSTAEDHPKRRWLAEVIRVVSRKAEGRHSELTRKDAPIAKAAESSATGWISKRKSHREESPVEKTDAPCYYAFVPEDLMWVRADYAADHFHEAVDGMAPEMRIFCILKSEANFGVRITWDQIQAALTTAVNLNLMEERYHKRYTEHMEALMLRMMTEEDMLSDLEMQYTELKEHVSEELRSRITLAPREVMAALSELGIVSMSDVWADFMD